MRYISKAAFVFLLLGIITHAAQAQSGTGFALAQAVIASGGGSDSNGNSGGRTFHLDGTTGQAVAGDFLTAPPYSNRSGFWSSLLAPTAAPVTVMGRVVSGSGRPVNHALVTAVSSTGVILTAVTSTFGYFRLDDIRAAETYVLSVRHRNLQFSPLLITPTADISDLVIVADQ